MWLLASVPLYSEPSWAADLNESELRTELVECVMLLETQTSATENVLSVAENQLSSLNEYRILTADLMSAIETRDKQLSKRDEQLSQAAISFNAYEKEQRRVMIRNTAIGFGVGVGAGAAGLTALYLYLR